MHNLIVGASYSGKTNLCKRFAYDAVMSNQSVLVYDPLKSTGWPKQARKISDPELFLNAIEKTTSAHVFIDEAKTLWNYDTRRADAILYQKRHQGILAYVIGQRAEGMIPPNARNQCSKLFAFKQSKKDAETLALEYTQPEIMSVQSLKEGEFIYTNSYSIQKLALDYSRGNPPFIKKR